MYRTSCIIGSLSRNGQLCTLHTTHKASVIFMWRDTCQHCVTDGEGQGRSSRIKCSHPPHVAKTPKWDGLRTEQWRSVYSSHKSRNSPCSKGSPLQLLLEKLVNPSESCNTSKQEKGRYCSQSHRFHVRNSRTFPTGLDALPETSWKNLTSLLHG